MRVETLAAGERGARELQARLAEAEVVFLHNVLTMPFDAAWTAALWQFAERNSAVRCVAWIHDLAACNADYSVAPDDLIARPCPQVEYVAISELRRTQFAQLVASATLSSAPSTERSPEATASACRVIPNGTDPVRLLGLSTHVAELAELHRLFSRDIVLLQPARLLRRKNVELSLQVLEALRARGSDAVLLVTGPSDSHQPASAGYAAGLRELRRGLGLDAEAIFLHDLFEVSEPDLRGIFAVSDALFFPSRQEGFGLPILEAALHRLPIFCNDIEPMSGMLGGALHLFSAEASPGEIAAQVTSALEGTREFKGRKAAMGESTWNSIYDKFLAPLL